MEITRELYHWMIYYDFKKGLTRQESLVLPCETFGNEALPDKIAYNFIVNYYNCRVVCPSVMNLVLDDQNFESLK